MQKVSILVPIYNVEKYIERCAVSLFEQTYDNVEFVFVDDKGTDSSMSILKDVIKRYPNRSGNVKIVDHVTNRGLASARNTALENSEGDFVIHVDSDDFVEKDMVERCVICQEQNDADIVLYGFRHLHSDRSYVELQVSPESQTDYINKLILRQTAVCVCGAMYRKELYIRNDVRAIVGLNMGEDYATKPRLAYFAKRICNIELPLYNYVHYNESSYTSRCDTKSIENLYRALEVLKAFFKEHDETAYDSALERADILQSVLLIKLWASTDSKESDLELIRQHIEKDGHMPDLSILDSFLILLVKYRMTGLLRLIVRGGMKIKHILK